MSRDFVPAQRFLANRDSGYDLWLINLEYEVDGVKQKVYTDEEQAIRVKYRNLAISLGGMFIRLYRSYPERTREQYIAKLEELQIRMQDALLKGREALDACDVPDTMKKWFLGELDPHFYYAETNDRMFYDWVKANVKIY